MDKLIKSVYNSLDNKNWYAALIVSLTLPDICVALERGSTNRVEYINWVESHLSSYKKVVSGKDFYYLRCSLLHQGIADISNKDGRDVLDYFIFLTEGPHINFISGNINGKEVTLLQLNVQEFCKDICKSVEKWLADNSVNTLIQERIRKTIEIHNPGYLHLGAIRFGK